MLILFSFKCDQKFTCKNSFLSYYLNLSRPVFLKFFLILPNCSLMFLTELFLLKKKAKRP